MLTAHLKSFGSIVFRLRLSYFLTFVFAIGVGISLAALIKDISGRKDDLTQRALPLLAQAYDLVTLLSVQSEQIVALQYADVYADFADIVRNFQSRQNAFDQMIGGYQSLSGDYALQPAAAALFDSTAILITLEQDRQRLSNRRLALLEDLRAIVDQIEIQIEELRLDVLTELRSNIDQMDRGQDVRNRVGTLSLQLNTLVSFGLRVEQMQDIVEGDGQNHIPMGSAHVGEELQFKLREILALMSRMPTSNQQRLIASEIARARQLITDDPGILSYADRQIVVQSEIEQSVATSLAQIRGIKEQIARIISTANNGAEETSTLLDQSIRAVSAANLLLVVFACGFVLVLVILVERQLNRRIQNLIAAVRRFAAGHYDDTITVVGTDELGEIADAMRLSQTVARDLARSNADLQSFAYAASHDLKTPLRAITDLADWTLEDARDELSEENFERLTLLSNRSKRLSHLLDGLLLYARVDGMLDQDEDVDLIAECATIADLADPDGHYPVVVVGPVPQFATAIVPLRQILGNLISNAIKHHDQPSGKIKVRARTNTQHIEIDVADDGPGIPPRFHAKIFELFQKLESRDVVEGAGIGLALVKKLAERHGGGVTLRSPEDGERGTVFTVTLALAQK